jgi:anti-anti-sigma factor
MQVQTQNYNNVTVVQLQGELTQETIKIFQDATSSIIADHICGMVIDMTKVGFIDSLGLEELLRLKEECRKHDCQLKLAGLEETCEKILEITRLASAFDVYEELAGAVKSFV